MLRVRISGDVKKAIKASTPDAVVLCTSSSIKAVPVNAGANDRPEKRMNVESIKIVPADSVK